jgi:UDP:flavonoid glycosyltransferase YjiC (YdhE family)
MASWMPHWLKRAMFRLSDMLVIERVMRPPVNAIRREMNLQPLKSVQEWWNSPRRIIGMFPDWFAPVQPDWPAQLRLSGFPLFDQADKVQLPADIEQFLGQGEPPVVFTAGSAMRHAADFFHQSTLACQRLGCRGLLVSRYPEQIPADLPPDVRHVSYVPFSVLIRRCSAFVHHGGIGTSAQGLSAGVPAMVVPLSHDQFDNAARLVRLGTALVLPRGRYRAPKVAAMLHQLLTDPRYTQAARDAAGRMKGADGLQTAANLIEQIIPAAGG